MNHHEQLLPNQWRKKPIVVEAVLFDGSNGTEISNWGGPNVHYNRHTGCVYIQTLEGQMHANQGDYIIKGIQGEIYPCKPRIFAATYEPVGTRTSDQRVDVPVLTAHKCRELLDVLAEHHKWHQEIGWVRLVANAETGLLEPVDIDLSLEYGDSTLCEKTERALYGDGAPQQEAAAAGDDGKHIWHEQFNRISCKKCGILKRPDGYNKSCKGIVRVDLRAQNAQNMEESPGAKGPSGVQIPREQLTTGGVSRPHSSTQDTAPWNEFVPMPEPKATELKERLQKAASRYVTIPDLQYRVPGTQGISADRTPPIIAGDASAHKDEGRPTASCSSSPAPSQLSEDEAVEIMAKATARYSYGNEWIDLNDHQQRVLLMTQSKAYRALLPHLKPSEKVQKPSEHPLIKHVVDSMVSAVETNWNMPKGSFPVSQNLSEDGAVNVMRKAYNSLPGYYDTPSDAAFRTMYRALKIAEK